MRLPSEHSHQVLVFYVVYTRNRRQIEAFGFERPNVARFTVACFISLPPKCLCVSTYLLVAALPPKLFCFWPQRRVQVAVRFWWPHLRVVPFDLCTLPHPNSPLTLLYTLLYTIPLDMLSYPSAYHSLKKLLVNHRIFVFNKHTVVQSCMQFCLIAEIFKLEF